MKLSNKEMLQDTLWILAGNIALAMGVAWFILPNDVLTGGLAGVAIALEPLIHLNPELVINVLTVVLFLGRIRYPGKEICGENDTEYHLLSAAADTVILSGEKVLATDTFVRINIWLTICGGALMGIGVGCVFRTGASTGGMDIPPLIYQ